MSILDKYIKEQLSDIDYNYGDKEINWLHKAFNNDMILEINGKLYLNNPKVIYRELLPAGLLYSKPTLYKARKAFDILMNQEFKGPLKPEWLPVLYLTAEILAATKYKAKDSDDFCFFNMHAHDCLYVENAAGEYLHSIREYDGIKANPNETFKLFKTEVEGGLS